MQAVSLSAYAAQGFPSNRIAPEVVSTAQRAKARMPKAELAPAVTWLTPKEDQLARAFLAELDAVQGRRAGDLFAREAVEQTLASDDYVTVCRELNANDADTVYAIWSLVDACTSGVAGDLRDTRDGLLGYLFGTRR